MFFLQKLILKQECGEMAVFPNRVTCGDHGLLLLSVIFLAVEECKVFVENVHAVVVIMNVK